MSTMTSVAALALRLLAREVYDRVSARVGEGAMALVTAKNGDLTRV